MQIGNRFAPGLLKRERQYRVNKASEAGFEQRPAEAARHYEMLAVSLADCRWMRRRRG